MKKYLLLAFCFITLCLLQDLHAQDVCFRNYGKIYISDNEDVSLYIQGSVRMLEDSWVSQQGTTRIEGDFIQDSNGNVFAVDEHGYGSSTGTISFSGENTGLIRKITTESENYSSADSYIAFPNIIIDTNDSIIVSEGIGMDALSIKRNSEASKKGVLWLRSSVADDATLRITSHGDCTQTDPGMVIVEREVGPYRGTLYPFASPYIDMPAVYFAGNWLRTPLQAEEDKHVTYLYAEKPSDDGTCIASDQYHTRALDILNAAQPYFLCLRSTDFDYSTVPAGYNITTGIAADKYNIDKFVFNGRPFDVHGLCNTGHLFSKDHIFNHSYTGEGKTINWIIANSYTSHLDYNKVVEALKSSSLVFAPVIYLYEPGSTNFTAYNIEQDDTPSLGSPDLIPAMGVFMVRISRNVPQNGTLTLGRELQTHGKKTNTSAPAPSAKGKQYADVLFTVAQENNPYISDRAVIGMRESGTMSFDGLDMKKAKNNANDSFSVYTMSSQGDELLSNAIPFDASSVRICFEPAKITGTYVLSASRVETMEHAETLMLHDEKTNTWTDLRQNESYTFTAFPADDPRRFTLYFSMESVNTDDLYGFWNENHILIKNVKAEDVGSYVRIYDVNGRLLVSDKITQYPTCEISVPVPDGIYISHISGNRQGAFKFIKQAK